MARRGRQSVRFGLIGTGRIGQVHAASIAANSDTALTWVADPRVEGAEDAAACFGGTPTTSPERLIASGEVDAILIASPTPTHIDLLEACTDVGLAVVCEKPVDLDIVRVDALRPKVTASSLPVALGFNQRFDPAFAETRAPVTAGEIGALEHLSIISPDPAPPPSDYVWRVIIIYVGSTALIVLLVPYASISAGTSPFVTLLDVSVSRAPRRSCRSWCPPPCYRSSIPEPTRHRGCCSPSQHDAKLPAGWPGRPIAVHALVSSCCRC